VVCAVERDGWVGRHGGDHDVYKNRQGQDASSYRVTARYRRGSRDRQRSRVARSIGGCSCVYIALWMAKLGLRCVVPDLPRLHLGWPHDDEALRNAVRSGGLWVEDAIDDGEALPPPRSVEALGPILRLPPALAAAPSSHGATGS